MADIKVPDTFLWITEADVVSLISLPEAVAALTREFPEQKAWPAGNMFFGGVHAASVDRSLKTFIGAGDPRRGGVAITL